MEYLLERFLESYRCKIVRHIFSGQKKFSKKIWKQLLKEYKEDMKRISLDPANQDIHK